MPPTNGTKTPATDRHYRHTPRRDIYEHLQAIGGQVRVIINRNETHWEEGIYYGCRKTVPRQLKNRYQHAHSAGIQYQPYFVSICSIADRTVQRKHALNQGLKDGPRTHQYSPQDIQLVIVNDYCGKLVYTPPPGTDIKQSQVCASWILQIILRKAPNTAPTHVRSDPPARL